MTESQLLPFLAIFAGGLVTGILATLIFNKVRSGKASAGAVKREFDDYQAKVEEHFDETSEKFKAMAEQYKDLYQHLSVGATSLCRPDHVVAGLSDQSDPLQPLPKPNDDVDKSSANTKVNEAAKTTEKAASDVKTESENQVGEKPAKAEKKQQASSDSKTDVKPNSKPSEAESNSDAGANKKGDAKVDQNKPNNSPSDKASIKTNKPAQGKSK